MIVVVVVVVLVVVIVVGSNCCSSSCESNCRSGGGSTIVVVVIVWNSMVIGMEDDGKGKVVVIEVVADSGRLLPPAYSKPSLPYSLPLPPILPKLPIPISYYT